MKCEENISLNSKLYFVIRIIRILDIIRWFIERPNFKVKVTTITVDGAVVEHLDQNHNRNRKDETADELLKRINNTLNHYPEEEFERINQNRRI